MHVSSIDYFAALEQLRLRVPRDSLQTCFTQVLSEESRFSQIHIPSQSEQDVSRGYNTICQKRSPEPPNFRATFDDYVSTVRQNLPPEKYVSFLRFLSLYITGKLPHGVFIKLFLNLFQREVLNTSNIFPYLPAFLASLSCSTFFTNKLDLPAVIEDKFALKTMLNITASISSSQVSKTVSKCLSCLATGLISKNIAKNWLQEFVNDEILQKFDEIDDFSYFHPSRFPHELILCPDFVSTEKNSSISQQFLDFEASLKPFSTYKPALRELCEVKMRGLRKAIRKLADGVKLTPEELFFAYGNSAYSVADCLPDCASLVIESLGRSYEQTQNTFSQIIHYQMKQFPHGHFEFRYLFKRLLKHETFAFHYQLPGVRKISFGKLSAANVAASIIYDFSNNYFKEKENNTIIRSLGIISSLLNPENKEKVYVVNEKHIFAVVYLASIAKLAFEAGNTDDVNINSDGSIMQCEQTTEFGKKIALIPKQIKSSEGLGELFPDFAFQHIDLHITRCVRQLSIFDEEDALLEYPDELSSSFIITTMKQEEDSGNSFNIICSSAFSPCFLDFGQEPSDDINSLNINQQDKDM